MFLKKWDDLPDNMKTDIVKNYYDSLYKKRFSLFLKRVFDFVFASVLLVLLSPLFLVLAVAIKLDSKGPVFFRQIRVTQYGRKFRIFKFRTMVSDAEKIGAQVTSKDDIRITSIGKFLRKSRLDETAQLLNIIIGDMSFVGTRPEVIKYVEQYSDEMKATLLLPAGVTSEASIMYKNEDDLLTAAENADAVYVQVVLPEKMKYNLENLKEYSFCKDIGIMFRTVLAVLRKKTAHK